MIPHRQTRTRLPITWLLRNKQLRPNLPQKLEPLPRRFGRRGLNQQLPEVIIQRDWRVGSCINATSDAGINASQRYRICHLNRCSKPRAARLLDIKNRRIRRQVRPKDTFPGQIEVARVLKYCSRGNHS